MHDVLLMHQAFFLVSKLFTEKVLLCPKKEKMCLVT